MSEFGYPQVTHDSTAAGDQPWIEVRQELVSGVAQEFEVSPPSAWRPVIFPRSASCSTASRSSATGSPQTRSSSRAPQIRQATSTPSGRGLWLKTLSSPLACCVSRARRPTCRFRRFSRRFTARPLQAALDSSSHIALGDPMLAVIEAPTGEGKTEAALLLAQRLIAQSRWRPVLRAAYDGHKRATVRSSRSLLC